MSTDDAVAVVEFQKALANLKAAEDAVTQVVGTVERAHGLLFGGNWMTALISGTSSQFPERVRHNPPDGIINGSNWPSASQIAEAICRWHEAKDSVAARWSALSPSGRTGFTAPEKAPMFRRRGY